MTKKSSSTFFFNSGVLKRIFQFAQPYRYKFFGSVFLSIAIAAMAPIRPYLIQMTLNHGVNEKASAYILKGPGAFIIELTIIQIFLLMIETTTRFYFTFLTASLGQCVVKDIRVNTFSKILQLNVRQFDQTPIGTLTTRTINDIESVNDVFSDGLIPIIADLLSILSVLTYMFYTDWKITLVCLIPFPFLIVATYFFKESVNKSFLRVRNAVSHLNSFVQEHLTGISVIQIFSAEKREQKKFQAINKEHRDANINAIFAYSVFFPIVELVSATSIGLLVWWSAKQSIESSPETAEHLAGIITSFILCLNLLFRPLRLIADKFNVLQMGMIAGERVFKVLDNNDVTPTGPLAYSVIVGSSEKVKGDLSFEKVSFSYSNEILVLKNISFEVPAGKTIAIVGNTGSGKSTIIHLINRLYQHSKGSIKIDNIPIENYELANLRSQIAVVLQDVFLFNGSILENLTLRNNQITREMVIHATKMIDLHDFIMSLPGGYDFKVMERGATLSMGQRQLLSFARAILFDPSILILDEATSSIDSESEVLIQNAIDKLIKGRTSVVIAHRLSTIKKADIIMVLDKGEIREIGTHEHLLHQKGLYFQLYNTQFSKREPNN